MTNIYPRQLDDRIHVTVTHCEMTMRCSVIDCKAKPCSPVYRSVFYKMSRISN